jgi:uncharacterized Rmd1/YagE family protein
LTQTWNFNAVAFTENFSMARVREALGAEPSRLDPKDSATLARGATGSVHAYRFGALAFCNVSSDQQKDVVTILRRHESLSDPRTTEDFTVLEDPSARTHAEFSHLIVDRMTPERIEIVAFTVAQSAAMSFYENLVDVTHARLDAMVARLEKTGNMGRRPRKLHALIADVVSMRSDVVGVLHLLDRPDLVWEDREMDTVYDDLRAVFDLKERSQALVAKLDHIRDSAELLLGIARDSRLFLVEASIVVLIVVELVLSFIR